MNRSEPVFPGDRVTREDPRYQTMVMGFNQRWVGSPEYVQVCGDTDQVVKTVQQAVDAGQRVTVRCGGHCYEDFVCDNQAGVIIDLSPMDGVYEVEPDVYCVEGGATLWNVYNELYRKYGVTLPGGSCYSVGVGGHVTGGGYGLLSRLHGLTIDYLYAVEVVVVDQAGTAQAITVSADSKGADERDLLWATQGGGGGSFGIVTKFLFRDAPAAPSTAWLLSQTWDWNALGHEGVGTLIKGYGEFLKANSQPGSELAGLFSLLHLFQNTAGSPGIALTMQYVGTQPKLLGETVDLIGAPAGARAAPVRIGAHQASLVTGSATSMPWLFATQTLNGSGPDRRGKYKSAYMVDVFPDNQIEALLTHLGEPSNPNPAALLQVDSYGCQVNAVQPSATAIPQRSSIMKLQYQTYWNQAGEDGPNIEWIAGFYEAMYGAQGPRPDATMDGCYVNYPDVDLHDWEYLYYKDGYPRLQRAKARWDPNDVFHHQQSVSLPGQKEA